MHPSSVQHSAVDENGKRHAMNLNMERKDYRTNILTPEQKKRTLEALSGPGATRNELTRTKEILREPKRNMRDDEVIEALETQAERINKRCARGRLNNLDHSVNNIMGTNIFMTTGMRRKSLKINTNLNRRFYYVFKLFKIQMWFGTTKFSCLGGGRLRS